MDQKLAICEMPSFLEIQQPYATGNGATNMELRRSLPFRLATFSLRDFPISAVGFDSAQQQGLLVWVCKAVSYPDRAEAGRRSRVKMAINRDDGHHDSDGRDKIRRLLIIQNEEG